MLPLKWKAFGSGWTSCLHALTHRKTLYTHVPHTTHTHTNTCMYTHTHYASINTILLSFSGLLCLPSAIETIGRWTGVLEHKQCCKEDEASLVCEDILKWKHLANSLLVSAPLTLVVPIFLPVGAFLPLAGRDVAPGRDVAAEEGYTSKTNSIYSTSQ